MATAIDPSEVIPDNQQINSNEVQIDPSEVVPDNAQPLQGNVSTNPLEQVGQDILNIPGAIGQGLMTAVKNIGTNVANNIQNPSSILGIPAAVAHGAGQGLLDVGTGLYNIPGTVENMMGGHVKATQAPQLQFGSSEAQQNPGWNMLGESAPYIAASLIPGGGEAGTLAKGLQGAARMGGMAALGTPTTDINQRITAGGAGALAGAAPEIAGAGFEAAQPNIAQFLARIPKEDYQTMLKEGLDGNNPFAGSNFKEIQNTLPQSLQKQAGQAVNQATWDLADKQVPPVPYSKINSMIENIKTQELQGADTSEVINKTQQPLLDAQVDHLIIPSLKDTGLLTPESLDSVKTGLKNGLNPDEIALDNTGQKTLNDLIDINNLQIKPSNLNKFKEAIDTKINWNTEGKPVNTFYENIRSQPDQILRTVAPDLAQANDVFSQIKGLTKNPKDFNLQGNPTNSDLVNQLQNMNARTSFEKLVPTGNGNPYLQTGFGTYGGISALHGNFLPLGIQAAYNIARSPMTQKAILQAYLEGQKLPNIVPGTITEAQQQGQ